MWWKCAQGRVLRQEVRIETERCSCSCISIADLRKRLGWGCIMCCFDTVSQGKAENILKWRLYPGSFPPVAVWFEQNKGKAWLQSWWKTIVSWLEIPDKAENPAACGPLVNKLADSSLQCQHEVSRRSSWGKKNALSPTPNHFPWTSTCSIWWTMFCAGSNYKWAPVLAGFLFAQWVL